MPPKGVVQIKEQSLYNPEIYQGDYWPLITYDYSRTWTEFLMPMHIHASVEIMYIFMGHCSVYVLEENGTERHIPMLSGDFVLLDCNTIHRLYVEPGSFCYMLNVEFVFDKSNNPMFTLKNMRNTADAFSRMIEQGKPVLTGNDTSGELYRAFNVLQNSYLRIRAQNTTQCILDAEMAVFLIQLSQLISPRTGIAGIPVHVKRALRYIENNFYMPMTITDIAEYVGVHPGYLHRIFKKVMGVTVVQYLTRLRVDKAMVLLEYMDNVRMDDIARQVGFGNRQHFTLCFKKLEMISPSEYRKTRYRVERTQYILDSGGTGLHHILPDDYLERMSSTRVDV